MLQAACIQLYIFIEISLHSILFYIYITLYIKARNLARNLKKSMKNVAQVN